MHVRCPSSSARAVDVLSLKEKDEITWGVGMAKSNLNPQPQLDSQKAITVISHQTTITTSQPSRGAAFHHVHLSQGGICIERPFIVTSTAINQTNHPNISWRKLLSFEDLLVFFSFFFFETSTFLAGPHKFLF